MRRIITLTTDFGYQDYYVGALKGKIRSRGIQNEIIDISHNINAYDIDHAGFVISAAYKHFPKGSIHIVAVKCEITEFVKPVVVSYDGHFFIAADNGVLSFLNKDAAARNIVLASCGDFKESLDVFIEATHKLVHGASLYEIGVSTEELFHVGDLNLSISADNSIIRGNVIYEDHFGNAITNISKSLFEKVRAGRDFKIKVKNKEIKKINKYFSDFNLPDVNALSDKSGDLLAIFNDLNLLQISVFYSSPLGAGSPKTLIGLGFRDSITIEFFDQIQDIIL